MTKMLALLRVIIFVFLVSNFAAAEDNTKNLKQRGFPTYGVALSLPPEAAEQPAPRALDIGTWYWHLFGDRLYDRGVQLQLVGPTDKLDEVAKSWAKRNSFTLTSEKTTLGKELAVVLAREFDASGPHLQPRLAALAAFRGNTYAFIIVGDRAFSARPLFDELRPRVDFGNPQPLHRSIDQNFQHPPQMCNKRVSFLRTPALLREFSNDAENALYQVLNTQSHECDLSVKIEWFKAEGTLQEKARAYARATAGVIKPATFPDWRSANVTMQYPALKTNSIETHADDSPFKVRWACVEAGKNGLVVMTIMLRESQWKFEDAFNRALDEMFESITLSE